MSQENSARFNARNVSPNTPRKITPELVRQVAERVYSMLRRELLIEEERARRGTSTGTGVFRP
jgi:hypothetical protein